MPKEPVPTFGRKKRPTSEPSSPRSSSPAPPTNQPLVQLSKVESARLNLEAENFAWRTKHKKAAEERHDKQVAEKSKEYEDRAAMAAAGREAVKTGLDYSMHGMLAHHGDDMDAYPNRPDGRKKKPIEPTAEMDGAGAKIQVQLPAE